MTYSYWANHAARRERMHDWSSAAEMWLQAYDVAADPEQKHWAMVRSENCLLMKHKVIH